MANSIETASLVDARKVSIGWNDVCRILQDVDEVYVAKGKQIIHFQLNASNRGPDVASPLLRPSGNLRTPAFRRGRTLVVGFDEATYRKILVDA